MLQLALLLATMPQGPATQAPTARYRFETKSDIVVDMSAFLAANGLSASDMPPGTDKQSNYAMALFSVTTKDSAGGKQVHIVIDSSTNNSMDRLAGLMDQVPPEMLAQMKATMGDAKGQTIDLFVLDGKQLNLVASAPQMLTAATVASALPLLFPPVKVDDAVGKMWTDTATVDTAVSAMGASVRPVTKSITNWKRTAKEIYDGQVSQEVSMSMSGAADMAMGGNMSGTTHFVIGKDGLVSQATSAMTGSAKMTVMGSDMTTKTISSATLTRVP